MTMLESNRIHVGVAYGSSGGHICCLALLPDARVRISPLASDAFRQMNALGSVMSQVE
jgi:hypothetical protein